MPPLFKCTIISIGFWLGSTVSLAAGIEAVTIDGKQLSGPYRGVANGQLQLGDNAKRTTLPLDELIEIRLAEPPSADHRPPQGFALICFAAGGQTYGRITAGQDGQVAVQTHFGPTFELRFEHLAAIAFDPAGDAAAAAAFATQQSNPLTAQDVLIGAGPDGQRAVGTLMKLGPKQGEFRFQNQQRSFALDSIYGVVLAKGTRQQLAPAIAELADGTQLPITLQDSPADQFNVTTPFGWSGSLALEKTARIRLTSARLVYLSDLPPTQQNHASLLYNQPWPMRVDRSVTNQPLRLGGQTYRKGLGVHARSSAAWPIDGQYERFCATIGIDDAARPHGQVVFEVVGDGRVLFKSGPVTGRDQPQPLCVDVTGVKELTLRVDYGDQLDLGDQANWAAARLIRPAPG